MIITTFLSSGSPGRFPWRSRMARRRNVAQSLFLAFLAALTFALSAASPLSADDPSPEEDFRAAIQVQDQAKNDQGSWKKSIVLLSRALGKRPEDGERIDITTNNFRRYIPHYYLGLARFRLEDCPNALKEWNQSLSYGFVQQNRDVFRDLLNYQGECNRKLH